ncbi:FAR1 DNA binding domain, zinc finger, SWIM-type, MULE transposase domain containing protein [Tanacetum coccineum]
MRSSWEDALFRTTRSGSVREEVFNDDEGLILFRMNIQSLAPGLEIDTSVIDVYVSILNYEEKFKMMNMKRHFFYTSMMVPGILEDKTTEIDKKIDAQYDRFHEMLLIQMENDVEKMQMEDVELAFFPIIAHGHYYLIVFNLKTGKSVIIDNSESDATYEGKYKDNVEFVIVSRIYDDTDFKDKFGKIVWNMFIGPEEFEDRWNKLMEEFNLVNHKWLSKMYRLRSSWVPAFFVDSPLCGLMRTTSRSESENSFFSYFTSSGSTLVKFMLCYESAMERQRYTQEKLDHQSFDSFPALLTPLPIEVHAANVYTRSLFIRVQKEIVAGSWLCSITGMSLDEGCTVCIIDEEKIKPVGLPEVIDKESTLENVKEEINLHQKVTGHYKVLYNKGDGSVSCCCQLFVRSGILCRHIFCVFKNFKVSCIPDQYILRRWTKDLIPPDLRNKKNRYGEKNEAIEKLAMEASIILDSCVHMLRNNELKLSVFVNKMKAIKSDLEAELPIVPTRTVSDFVQEFMGVKKPDKVKVKNPTGVRPKGREKQKRIKSGREISMKKSMKKIVVPGGSDHVVVGLRDGTSGSVSV